MKERINRRKESCEGLEEGWTRTTETEQSTVLVFWSMAGKTRIAASLTHKTDINKT